MPSLSSAFAWPDVPAHKPDTPMPIAMPMQPRPLAAQPKALDVRLAIGRDAALALAGPWRALEASARQPSFFQSSAWCCHLLRTLGDTDGNQGLKPVVATAWLGGALVAVWPLAVRHQGGARILSALGQPYDQGAEILIGRRCDLDPDVVLDALVGAVRAADLGDGLILRQVRPSGDVFGLTRHGARVVDDGALAPQVEIDVAAPWAAFLETIAAKTRKNLRNYTNRLGRLGELRHRVLTGADVAPAIAESFDRRRAWLDVKGLSSSAFRDTHFESVVHGLGGADAADLGLIVFALMLDERPIAIQWGFVDGNRYYAYLSSLDPEFEDYSAGRIHLQYVLQACHARGISTVDLMVPALPYKMTWTDKTVSVVDLVLPWTARGYLVLEVYQRHLRPHLKRLAQRLPLDLRQRVFALVNAGRR